MPERSLSLSNYRFGFNGKEKDDETKGIGNSIDFGSRAYDPRLGKWLSLDPLYDKYPYLSPYNFVGNKPLIAIDPDGKRIYYVNASGEFTKATRAMVRTASGSELFLKYARSKKEDVYIGVGKFGKDASAVGLTAPNAESSNSPTGIFVGSDSKIHMSNSIDQESRSAFSTFNNTDFSKSKGKEIHLITISDEALKTNDAYTNAETVFHELKSHVDINTGNAEKDHELYGKSHQGLYMEKPKLDGDGNNIPDENGNDEIEVVPKNSPAGKMVQELLKLKDKDNSKPKK